MKQLMGRFLADEAGQDLIEYALLTTVIGLVGIVGLNLIRGAIGLTYTSWNTGVNNLWVPPNSGS
jgi:Flp pilus assembly pilin Flp